MLGNVMVRVLYADGTSDDLSAATRATATPWLCGLDRAPRTAEVGEGSCLDDAATTLGERRGRLSLLEPSPGARTWRTCLVESWEQRAVRLEQERDIACLAAALHGAEVERLRWLLPKIERAATKAQSMRSAAMLGTLVPAARAVADLEDLREQALRGARMPDVAVVVVPRRGRVLAVERRSPPGEQGLPGGKLRPGEVPVAGAARELAEETGLHVDPTELVMVHEGEGIPGVWLRAYVVVDVEGEPRAAEGLAVGWLEPGDLLARAGAFGVPLRRIFDAVNAANLIPWRL